MNGLIGPDARIYISMLVKIPGEDGNFQVVSEEKLIGHCFPL